MPLNVPTIVKTSETLLVTFEEAVASFPRYHKYAIGAELREQARAIARAARRAWSDRERRCKRIEELSVAIDELKLSLQIAQRLHALKSFGQFEALARLVNGLGQQCGGWRKKYLKSQNREAGAPPGRAQILSAHGASQGAQP